MALTETEKQIRRKIEAWVKENSTLSVDYSRWYVGVTNNENARKSQHKSQQGKELYFWQSFNARSRKLALAIELHFHKKGMLEKDVPGGTAQDSKLVYVYKKYPTILD